MTKKDKEIKEKKTRTKRKTKDKNIKISNNINIKIGTEKTRTKRKYTRRDTNKTKAQMGDGSQNRHTPVAMSQPNIIMPQPPTDYNKLAKDYLAPQTEAIQKQLLLMAPPTPAPAPTPAPMLAIKGFTPASTRKGKKIIKKKAPITDITSFSALKKETIPELKKIFANYGVPDEHLEQIKKGKKDDAIRAFIAFQKSKVSKTPSATDPYDYFDENRTTGNTPKREYATALFNVDTPSSVNSSSFDIIPPSPVNTSNFGVDPNDYNQPFETGIATTGNFGQAVSAAGVSAPTSPFAKYAKTPYDSDTDIDIGPPSGNEYSKKDVFLDSDSGYVSKKQISPFKSHIATTSTTDIATLPSQEASSISLDQFVDDSDGGKTGGGIVPVSVKKTKGRPKATSAIQTKNQPKTPAPIVEAKAAANVNTRGRPKKKA